MSELHALVVGIWAGGALSAMIAGSTSSLNQGVATFRLLFVVMLISLAWFVALPLLLLAALLESK